MRHDNVDVLLFDFGNVIINIDFDLLFNEFKQLFGQRYDAVVDQLHSEQFFQKVESGIYNAQQMSNWINALGFDISADQMKNAWNALLLDIPEERLQLLDELSKQYPMYLLSNTNLVHIEKIFGDLEKKYGYNPIEEVFDDLFLSYQIGHVKPSRNIYDYVLDTIQVDGQQCLFFDDLQENLDGAAKCGIQTQLITKDFGILDYFNEEK